MADSDGIVIGVLASHEDRSEAETLAESLPQTLSERIDAGAQWRTELCGAEPADVSASPAS
jgi:hypothetical protein